MSLVNKKKIRGWKRQIRKVEQWKQAHLNLRLNEKGYDYVKIWIDPWYRLVKRTPPVWLRRLMLKGLLEIYDSWFRQLSQAGEPFYLKIWLYDPHFINSQVVAGVGHRVAYYETLFVPDATARNFPLKQYQSTYCNLLDYDWVRYIDEDVCLEKGDQLNQKQLEDLKTKAHRIEEVADDTVYALRKGSIWTGSRKGR